MKQRIGFLVGAVMLGLMSTVSPTYAAGPAYEVEYTNDQPLMVIRFNQRNVMYERPLYNTISNALEVKPSAVFDIVSVSPKGRNSSEQAMNDQITKQNTHKVLSTLQEIGLPQSRINLTNASDDVDASEVRIFVR